MDEQILNVKHRRRPFVAVFFSFISIGLGHIYCGRIAKGFIIAFIGTTILPVISYVIVAGFLQANVEVLKVILILSLIPIVMWIAVIIDSYLIAKKTRPDYELKEYNRWYFYVIFYFLILSSGIKTVLNIKSDLVEAFRVPTFSMYPALEYHDCFLANKKAYKREDPNCGDIIVFVSPENRKEMWIKRVVAVAGDTVEMKNNQLIINGETLKREELYTVTYVGKDPNKNDVNVEGKLFVEKNGEARYEIFLTDKYDSKSFPHNWSDFSKRMVPKNHCFVLGDNRNLSVDSRHCGPIPLSTVKGRAESLYWPAKDWSRFGIIQ